MAATVAPVWTLRDAPGRGDRMLHLEHPTRIGTAWCGAPVLGVRVVAQPWKVDCVVCADLRRESRRRRP